MLVQLQKITKNYGTIPLFEHLDMQINEGEKIGLIGTNGSGKSTILKLIADLEAPDGGVISRKKNCKIGYLSQIPEEKDQEVKESLIETFTELNKIQKQLTILENKMAMPNCDLEKILILYGSKQEEFQQAGGYEMESRLEMIVNGLKINHLLKTNIMDLSGGEKTLVDLARLLLQENDIVLLDEPTNHLDAERITWLEGYLSHEKTASLIVSHDRLFLDHVVEKIVELDLGDLKEYKGNYSSYKRQKELELEQLKKNFAEQQKEIKKIKLAIRRFRQWGHEGDNEKFFKKAKELERRLEKMLQIPKPKENEMKMGRGRSFKIGERSGKEVIQFEQVSKRFGNQSLFKEVNFSLLWKDRVAVIGKNGSGKSTLLKLILGMVAPDEGRVKRGSHLSIGYLPQSIEFEEPTRTVLQEIMRACSVVEQEGRRLLANYSFYQEDVTKQVRFLSGGEKIRLELAKLMYNEVNFLLLDEPTNHLDIEAREEIEEILDTFKGTLLVISHDRFFLQKMFDTFFVVEHQQINKVIGSYLEVSSSKLK